MSHDVLLFSDGACSLDGTASGAGFLIRSGDRIRLGARPLTGIASTSGQAEMLALCEGVRQVVEAFPGTTRISAILDSESTVKAVRGWDVPRGREGVALQALRVILAREGIALDAHWTKGHADEGTPYGFANAVVDRLAKTGQMRGERIMKDLTCADSNWASAVSMSTPCLHDQPRYVGPATAAAWLGVPVASVAGLHGPNGLTAADRGLISMTSVRRMRRESMAYNIYMPAMGGWSPGALVAPAPAAPPVVCVHVFTHGDRAGVGCAVKVDGDLLFDALAFAAPDGKLAAEIDGVRYAILRLADRLPPMAEIRLHVSSVDARDLIDRTAVTHDRSARQAITRLRDVAGRCRARLSIQAAGTEDVEALALGRIANHLAWQTRDGTALEGHAYASPGWYESPEFYGDLGMDPPGAHVAAWEEEPPVALAM